MPHYLVIETAKAEELKRNGLDAGTKYGTMMSSSWSYAHDLAKRRVGADTPLDVWQVDSTGVRGHGADVDEMQDVLYGKIDPLALKRLETYTRDPKTGEVAVETHPAGHVLLVELAQKREVAQANRTPMTELQLGESW